MTQKAGLALALGVAASVMVLLRILDARGDIPGRILLGLVLVCLALLIVERLIAQRSKGDGRE